MAIGPTEFIGAGDRVAIAPTKFIGAGDRVAIGSTELIGKAAICQPVVARAELC